MEQQQQEQQQGRRVRPRLEVSEVRQSLRFEARWLLGAELGRGKFGRVYVATSRVDPSDVRAVKKISKADATANDDPRSLWAEVDIMRRLRHPHIIQLHDYYDDRECIILVMERAGGTILESLLARKGRQHFTELDAQTAVFQALSGLKHMHDQGVVHRDVKFENLLCFERGLDGAGGEEERGGGAVCLKLADLGCSAVLEPEPEPEAEAESASDSKLKTGNKPRSRSRPRPAGQLQGLCGSPGFIAPEVLRGEGHGRAVDLWALGVVAYSLLCGFPPWELDQSPASVRLQLAGDFFPMGPAEQKTGGEPAAAAAAASAARGAGAGAGAGGEEKKKKKKEEEEEEEGEEGEAESGGDAWGTVSAEAKDFVRRLLTVCPHTRPTAGQALAHPWLRAAPESLAGRSLDSALRRLRRLQARRRVGALVKTVFASVIWNAGGGNASADREASGAADHGQEQGHGQELTQQVERLGETGNTASSAASAAVP